MLVLFHFYQDKDNSDVPSASAMKALGNGGSSSGGGAAAAASSSSGSSGGGGVGGGGDNSNLNFRFSHSHDGLFLFLSRLLRPLWHVPMVCLHATNLPSNTRRNPGQHGVSKGAVLKDWLVGNVVEGNDENGSGGTGGSGAKKQKTGPSSEIHKVT